MSLPYYKRFPRDLLEATIGMSFEAKGAYGLVIDLIFMRDGRLEDDARYIAGQLGCSVRKWTAIRAELVAARKLIIENGIISSSIMFDQGRKMGPLWHALRAAVLERDGYTCTYCGDTAGPMEADHVRPAIDGGEDTLENLVCACRTCNRSKGAKPLATWLAL